MDRPTIISPQSVKNSMIYNAVYYNPNNNAIIAVLAPKPNMSFSEEHGDLSDSDSNELWALDEDGVFVTTISCLQANKWTYIGIYKDVEMRKMSEGDEYYSITIYGGVHISMFIYKNDKLDKLVMAGGNHFKTKEEAQPILEEIKKLLRNSKKLTKSNKCVKLPARRSKK